MPLVFVVEADPAVHAGEIEHPARLLPLQQVGRGLAIGHRKTDHRPVPGDEHPGPGQDGRQLPELVRLLGVGDQPAAEKPARFGGVQGQVRVLDPAGEHLQIPVQGGQGIGTGGEDLPIDRRPLGFR